MTARTQRGCIVVPVMAALILAMPVAACAQRGRLQLDHLTPLAAKAREVVDITLDPAMLKLATGFLSTQRPNDAAVQDLLSGIEGIYVKTFEFDRDKVYTDADVDGVRRQFAAPGWSRMVATRQQGETVDVYAWREGERMGGLAVVVAEPRELTVVNIVGPIDLAKLRGLQGQFGIPRLPTDVKEHGQDPK
jgi:hypothetical protein